jgi:hypothetical protein
MSSASSSDSGLPSRWRRSRNARRSPGRGAARRGAGAGARASARRHYSTPRAARRPKARLPTMATAAQPARQAATLSGLTLAGALVVFATPGSQAHANATQQVHTQTLPAPSPWAQCSRTMNNFSPSSNASKHCTTLGWSSLRSRRGSCRGSTAQAVVVSSTTLTAYHCPSSLDLQGRRGGIGAGSSGGGSALPGRRRRAPLSGPQGARAPAQGHGGAPAPPQLAYHHEARAVGRRGVSGGGRR